MPPVSHVVKAPQKQAAREAPQKKSVREAPPASPMPSFTIPESSMRHISVPEPDRGLLWNIDFLEMNHESAERCAAEEDSIFID